MDHDDDGETSYNTFVDDVAFEPTYSQALLTAAGRNVATHWTLTIITAQMASITGEREVMYNDVFRVQMARMLGLGLNDKLFGHDLNVFHTWSLGLVVWWLLVTVLIGYVTFFMCYLL